MSNSLVLVRVNHGFAYATDADKEAASSIKLGQAIRINYVKNSARSLGYHQRYWAGLLEITLEYWEPSGSMITEVEERLVLDFCKQLDENGGGGTIASWGADYLEHLAQKRSSLVPSHTKTKSMLHRWIKEKSGCYDIELTPSGPRKVLRSINFNAMGQEKFQEFYKLAFNVCWKYVLSKVFDTDDEANNAISQLLSVE
jgi:hypothetical protein